MLLAQPTQANSLEMSRVAADRSMDGHPLALSRIQCVHVPSNRAGATAALQKGHYLASPLPRNSCFSRQRTPVNLPLMDHPSLPRAFYFFWERGRLERGRQMNIDTTSGRPSWGMEGTR